MQTTGRRDLAFEDALTGLANRRALDAALERACANASKSNVVSVAICDVDFFKRVNDRYGHPAGDAVLREVASRMRGCVPRGEDVVARYGGEEFCFVAALTPLAGAIQVAEAIRQAVAEKPIVLPDGTTIDITISIGAAELSERGSAESLLDNADRHLLRAKKRGKNRVCADGYESNVASAAFEPRTHNFPRQRTAFFGRVRELELIRDAITRGRCVTLLGMGGVGKTRLAQNIAVDVASAYADGAWFVDLTQIREHGSIAGELAKIFGIANRDPAVVFDALSVVNALVVFDNCEHVIDDAASAAEKILASCPGITILCTSREALRVEGEAELAIRPMVDDDAPAALEIFLDRIGSTFIGTTLGAEDRVLAQHVCDKLEGIPLALELAAAGLRHMTLGELDEALAERFETLSEGPRTASRRQQTLRGIFDWSYELLEADERALFRRLSAFVSGWSVDSASAICALDDEERASTASVVVSLVAKSLVVQESRRNGVRYRFLETTRDYAREHFLASSERDAVVRAHARYFTDFAFERAPYFGPLFSDASIDELRGEEENLHSALAWLIDNDMSAALRMSKGLRAYWGITGHHAALASIERLMSNQEFGLADRAWLYFAHSTMVHWIKDAPYETAYANAEQALTLYTEASDEAGIAWSEFQVYRALKTLRTHPDRRDRALSRARELFEKLDDRRGKAELFNHAGTDAMFDCDFPRAETLYRQSLGYYRELKCDTAIIGMNSNIGLARYYQGDYQGAIALFKEVIGELQGFGSRRQFAFAQMNLGDVLIAMQRYDEARDALCGALDTFEALGFDWGYANTASHFGRLAWAKGDAAGAARIFGFAAAQFRAKGLERQPGRQWQDYLRIETEVREALADAFDARWNEGALMLRSQFAGLAAGL